MSRNINYTQVIEKLSQERFLPYLRHACFKQSDAYVLYCNHLNLTKNFYPFLHILEIALRNSINDLFIKNIGEQWFLSSDYKNFFSIKEETSIKEAVQKARIDTVTLKSNHVLTNLHFGFWTSIFNVFYNNFWIENNRLNCLFNNTKPINLKVVRKDLNKIRKFRNRIAHHEPIWKDKEYLLDMKNLILRYILAISDDMHSMALSFDFDTDL